MIKKAFTFIEIIVVIIVLSILLSIVKISIPDFTLSNDSNFFIQRIKQKQHNALGLNHLSFSNSNWSSIYYDNTCIEIDKDVLNTKEKNSIGSKKYIFHQKTEIKVGNDFKKICFDNLGRVYKNNYQLNNLLKMPIDVNITYKNNLKEIVIMPYTGSIIVK